MSSAESETSPLKSEFESGTSPTVSSAIKNDIAVSAEQSHATEKAAVQKKSVDSQRTHSLSPKRESKQLLKAPTLEELDKKLEEMHEMTELGVCDPRDSNSIGSCPDASPSGSDGHPSWRLSPEDDDSFLRSVQLDVGAQEQFNSSPAESELSEDERSNRAFANGNADYVPGMTTSFTGNLEPRDEVIRQTRQRFSSNAFNSGSSCHGRARSNDSRSTSFFSSSIASLRRPISRFSVDNSCFELDHSAHHSLACTPVEKMFVKASRSAPEMSVHDVKAYDLPSSNENVALTGEPCASDVSVDPLPSPQIAGLQLWPQGLNETTTPVPPVSSPLISLKKKKDKSKDALDLTLMKPSTSFAKADDSAVILLQPTSDVELRDERTFDVVDVQIKALRLVRATKKPLYVMAKLDAQDGHFSPEIFPQETSSPSVHEFALESTNPFNQLRIIFLEDSRTKVARPVGKVTLKKDDIANCSKKKHTLKLSAVSKYPEFCGQICVEISRRPGIFSLRVIDYGGLQLKETQQLHLLVSTLDKPNEPGKLSIGPDRRSREWLDMPCADGLLSLRMTLWQDLLKGLNSAFHGQVRVDVDERWRSGPAKWFYLRSQNAETKEMHDDGVIGEVDLCTSHRVDHLLDLNVYRPLMDLLSASCEIQPLTASLVSVIESLPKVDLELVSHSLFELMSPTNQLRPLLVTLYENNIYKCQDENTLFRGQSLAGKMLFEIVKTYGKTYIITTLKPVIDKIYKEHKNCEIDPTRLTDSLKDKNAFRTNLLAYFNAVFECVTNSAAHCPHFIKVLLADLRGVVAGKTGRNEMGRLAISSFVIMRFFAAAVLNPRGWEIRKDQPDLRVLRSLLLLSKMLQRVANCTVSERPLSKKEPWLSDVLVKVTGEEYTNKMAEFLDRISLAVYNSAEKETVTVFKRGQLQQVYPRRRNVLHKIIQPKKCYVQLTDTHIIWHKGTEGAPKGSVMLAEMKSVSVDDKHTITIASDCTHMQFEASVMSEATDWVVAIEKQRKRVRRESIYTSNEPFVYDVEKHLDRIHCVLFKYMDTMAQWLNELENVSEDQAKFLPELLRADYLPEELRANHKKRLGETLHDTLAVTRSIQSVHAEYEAFQKELAEQNQQQKIE